MSNKITSMIAAIALMGASIVVGSSAVSAVACPNGSIHAGENKNSLAECNLEDTSNNLMSTVSTIINVIIGVVGIVSVIFIVIGGLSYVTSAGDPGKAKKAKDTILYAVIGLIVAVLAFAIVNFVLASVFSGGAGGSGSGSGSSH